MADNLELARVGNDRAVVCGKVILSYTLLQIIIHDSMMDEQSKHHVFSYSRTVLFNEKYFIE